MDNLVKNIEKLITPETINFNELVKNSDTKLSIHSQSIMVELLNQEFTEEESQFYIASLFMYLNFHPTMDFPVNLEHVFRMIGFANKGNAKRTLENNFTVDEDYKITILPSEKGQIAREDIILNVDTLKNLFLIAKTPEGKKARKYFIKIENMNHKVFQMEMENTQKQLEEKDQELINKDQLIQLLENKPDTEGFYSKNGYNYLIKDKSNLGSYKIGYGEDPDNRAGALNVGSSQKSLVILYLFESKNVKWSEKIIHILLEPFRIKRRSEWFYLPTDYELNYAVYTMKNVIEYTDKYSFIDYDNFKQYSETIPNVLKENTKVITENYKNTNFLSKTNKVSKYNGVSFSIENNKWTSRLHKNNESIFLGYYPTQLEAAIIYNDYASYININQNKDEKYQLNILDNYIPNPRDIVEERNNIKLENKSSKYNGVYFIKSKQIFECGINYKKKSYKLYKNNNEDECAKVYNEQALYFNNNLNTKYKLNEIDNFITNEKNHIHELEINKIKKYSRFTGVTIRNDTNKFRSYIKYNRKVINCGTFVNEIDAGKAYNKKAEELNLLETTKSKYKLNVFDEDENKI